MQIDVIVSDDLMVDRSCPGLFLHFLKVKVNIMFCSRLPWLASPLQESYI